MDYKSYFDKIFPSGKFRVVFVAIVVAIVLLLVFKAGEFVGYKKAGFSYRWAENYHHNFGGPRGGFFRDFDGKNYMNAHGIFGSVIKIDQTASSSQAVFIIKGDDNIEKTILVSDKTTIMSRHEAIKAGDLKVDDRVTVIGSPNELGQIEAKLIRLFK